MSRKIRESHKNNIVIVCEGSDTEPFYLFDLKKYLKNRFDDVRIVPFGSEAKDAMSRDTNLKSSRRKRTTNAPKGNKSGKFYWVMEEEDEESYERFRQQPTRYVREAQLFLDEGYVEAWAVYDHDKFPDHSNARELAGKEPKVNIAFSSVSFEEWLLLHFERCPKAFLRSCCKEDKKDIGCGDHLSDHPNDCHGKNCVAGYLREKNYIRDFSKSKSDLYTQYSKNRLTLARINAAWVRSLWKNSQPAYDKNPYTDFDKLIERLLGLPDHYIWIGDSENTLVGKSAISIQRNRTTSIITIQNTGHSTFLSSWSLLDNNGIPEENPARLMLSPDDSIDITCPFGHYLCIGDDKNKYIVTP